MPPSLQHCSLSSPIIITHTTTLHPSPHLSCHHRRSRAAAPSMLPLSHPVALTLSPPPLPVQTLELGGAGKDSSLISISAYYSLSPLFSPLKLEHFSLEISCHTTLHQTIPPPLFLPSPKHLTLARNGAATQILCVHSISRLCFGAMVVVFPHPPIPRHNFLRSLYQLYGLSTDHHLLTALPQSSMGLQTF